MLHMELNKKDKDVLDSLINPADSNERRYKFDKELQQKVLGMLIADRYFLTQSISLIKPEYFNDPAHAIICTVLFDYFKQYKHMPTKIVLSNEIKEKRKNDQHIAYFLGELDAIISTFIPGVHSREYFLDKIREFAKEQAVYTAVSKTIDIVYKKRDDRWQKIWDVWRDALTIDRGYDIGLDYFSSIEERHNALLKEKDSKEIFSSGFPDKMDGLFFGIDSKLAAKGLCRGELGAYLGTSASGKSMALINAAANNLELGKKVLYLTLEMNEVKIARRFDSILSGESYNNIVELSKQVQAAISEINKDEEDKRRLIIKHFPGGTANIDTIRSYLSQLNLFGFKPDLLVLDYVGELKDIEGVKTYESRQRLVRDLRTLGVEENHCSLTAMQANRKGREDQELGLIDDDSLADSFGQVRVLDALWSINRRYSHPIEYMKDRWAYFGEIFIVKHRDGESRGDIKFMQDRDNLRMVEVSREVYNDAMSKASHSHMQVVGKKIPKKEY
jgi:replicative DNA helicase